MSDTPDRPGWHSAPGWMKLMLVASLALNLIVAGLIGGNALRHWSEPSYANIEAEPGLDRRQTRLLRMVPEPARPQAREILLSRTDEIDRARKGMREAHMAFIEAIRAQPLELERLEAALARRHAASAEFWQIGMEQMVEIARALEPAQRVELADRFEERTRRWMAKWQRKEREDR